MPSSRNTQVHTLSARNLSCERGRGSLFKQVSFSLASGQAMIVTGANGAGKTSLLKIITGLSRASEGQVSWDGKDIHQQPETYQKQLLYVGHRAAVKAELTVRENLELIMRLRSSQLQATEMTMDLVELAEIIGLRRRLSVPSGRLSAGQQRRVALARLFISHEKCWILDEPLTALDVSFIEVIEKRIAEHLNNAGILMLTTHRGIQIDDAKITTLEL